MAEPALHELFKRWVETQPDALAVASATRRLTYAELDREADLLANRLVAAGAVPGDRVAILANRGPDLVVAKLGILAAGAAFVAVDPNHPWARIDQVLRLSRPTIVLADRGAGQRHGTELASRPSTRTIPISRPDATAPRLDLGPPAAADLPRVTGAQLAYVAFTSGSTGAPKGIPHTHQTMAQFVGWQGEAFGVRPGARVAQLAPQGFDVSFCEIFGSLCCGASLHIPDDDTRDDPALLGAWLRDEGISLLQIVPAHWRALLTELPAGHAWPALDTVLFVGEALSPTLILESRDRLRPAPSFVNVYGPTEVVAATYHEVGPILGGTRSVPIGRPIPGRDVLLVDENDGIGEIYVRSRHLTAGYLGDEAGTQERFGPNPIDPDDHTVVYRTGDLARRLPSGELVFVGRADNQVKLRGQRIELEDVEAAIGTVDVVREVAVDVRPLADGSPSLVAFVAPTSGAAITPPELRRRLNDALPRYMVPSIIEILEQLPRNTNGKIDRTAVAALPLTPASGGTEFQTPEPTTAISQGVEARNVGDVEGDVEAKITAIWQELLGLDGIPRDADLFSLGGDSLLATRLISRIRGRLGIGISLGTFFDDPTVAGLVTAASSARARAAAPLLVPPATT